MHTTDGRAEVCALISNWLTTYRDLARMPAHKHAAHDHVELAQRVERDTAIADELERLLDANYADRVRAGGAS